MFYILAIAKPLEKILLLCIMNSVKAKYLLLEYNFGYQKFPPQSKGKAPSLTLCPSNWAGFPTLPELS